MAIQSRQEKLKADIEALDSEIDVRTDGPAPANLSADAHDDEPKFEPRTLKEKNIAAHFEAERNAADQAPLGDDPKPSADAAMKLLQDEIASLRAANETRDAEADERAARAVASEREQYSREREQRKAADVDREKRLADYEEAERKAATKLTAAEEVALVDKYGEDEAKDRKAMIEESRQSKYDVETMRREMTALKDQVSNPRPQAQSALEADAAQVKQINEEFSPFNEIAKPFGTWNAFTQSGKFKTEIATDAEFNELFMEAFTRENGRIVGVKPAIAKAAKARLAELMKGAPESRPPAPLQSATSKMNASSVDEGKAEMTQAEYSKSLRLAQKRGTLADFGKKLDQSLKRPTIN